TECREQRGGAGECGDLAEDARLRVVAGDDRDRTCRERRGQRERDSTFSVFRAAGHEAPILAPRLRWQLRLAMPRVVVIREDQEPIAPLDRLVDAVDCVSFDIFDTAVLRRIETPVAVFAVVAGDFRARMPDLGAFDYGAARRLAEVRAREQAWQERRA